MDAKQNTSQEGAEVAEARVCDVMQGHDFVAEYYGWRCTKCGLFHPNTEPLDSWRNPDFE